MAITVEQIHEAADKLSAEGIRPTQTTVREALGGGSFTTIGVALKTWREEQQQHEELKRTEMPDNIKDEGIVLIAKIWQTADQLANDKLVSEREAIAITNGDLRAEVIDKEKVIETLEAEGVQRLESLGLANEKADKAINIAEEKSEECVQLNSLLIETRHKLDMEQERTATAQAASLEINNKLDSTREQLENVNQQLSQARESIATYKAISDGLKDSNSRLETSIAECKQQHEVTRSQLTDRTSEYDELSRQLAAAQGKLEAVSEQNKQLHMQLDTIITDNKNSAVDNSKLQAINERLEQDKAQLIADLNNVSLERDGLSNDKKTLLEEVGNLNKG